MGAATTIESEFLTYNKMLKLSFENVCQYIPNKDSFPLCMKVVSTIVKSIQTQTKGMCYLVSLRDLVMNGLNSIEI